MARMYGHRWVSAYGERDDGTWAAGLAGMSVEQLAAGIRQCLRRSDPWPPTLPEFVALCGGERRSHAGMYRTVKALPKPRPDPEKVRAHIEELRQAIEGEK